MQDFKKLDVWNRSHQLTLSIYKVTKAFPKEELFGLTSQMRRCAVSIEANISEGCGRGGKYDFARYLQISLGSASELECHLMISFDLNLLDKDVHQQLEGEVQGIKRMLTTLATRVRS